MEDGPQDISEMPRDAEQPAMQSSQAVPAGHLHQGLADSAGGSIRPGRPSAAVPSPGELDILSGGVAPTGMTPFDCLSRADAPHDSSAHQQHVPASQQPAHAGSGSGLSPSCVPADESPMHEANRSEPVHGVPLSDQPEVFACPQTDREVQQWSAMFAQAYLQTGSEPVQHGVPASQAQTPGDSGGQQWQPADGSSSFGHVQGSADNLQRSDLADLLDGPGLHGDDLWLVAFLLQVHLQGCLVSMQRADLDEAVEAFASSMSGPDSMQRNVAPDGVAAASLRGTQESAVNGFDSQDHHPVPHMPSLLHSSSSSSATGMGSHTDSVPSEADDTSVIDIDDVEVIPALRPQFEDSFPSQQHFGPRSPALSAHMQEAEGYRR